MTRMISSIPDPSSALPWPLTPTIDHHQHLCSPAVAEFMGWGGVGTDAAAVIAHMDRARVERAVALSLAYLCGDPTRTAEHEYAQVKAANDWTGDQVARF